MSRRPLRIWLWWSSGKDSAWALHTLRDQDTLEVCGLITTVTQPFDRVSMHGTRASILAAQAAAVGLPLRRIDIPWPCSNAEYETAVARVIEEASAAGVTGMAFGDLHLEDVRRYREQMLDGTGIEPLFPLWGADTAALARAMIDAGLDARITTVDPTRLPARCAGARFAHAFLDALPESVDPCGEYGEFHTCVLDGPMFDYGLDATPGEVVERDGFVFADLVPLAR
ncbi:MAG: adenine nucleotide alpha hydrolase [Gemmatimonadetes bacterium]|nr:adenine nucleotide alpha hydrolase [Gemmatimonadota bacterium]